MSDALQRLIDAVEAGEVSMNQCAAAFPSESAYGVCTWHHAWAAHNGSLDAAKTLHDALLPNWVWWFEPFREIAFCGVYNPEISPLPFTSGDVCPARAWLLAILRAYQQVQQ